MTKPRPGATPGEWAHFADVLGLGADLLPCVADTSAKISAQSKMRTLGKTPSRFNANGEVVGIPHWTVIHASDAQITKWSQDDRLSICLQTRHVRGIDIDVADLALAGRIRARICQLLQVRLPARARPGTGRVLLGCTVVGAQSKRVVRLADDAGIVEYLADGQQFVVAGAHSSGTGRYFWEGGLPLDFPEVDAARLAECLAGIEREFGCEGLGVQGAGPQGRVAPHSSAARVDAPEGWGSGEGDACADWLNSRGFLRSADPDRRGGWLIHCPFEHEHTCDSGESETVYYPAGTGGYLAGHFKCLHAHCAHRTDADFLDAIGWRFHVNEELTEIDDDASFDAGPRSGHVRLRGVAGAAVREGGQADRGPVQADRGVLQRDLCGVEPGSTGAHEGDADPNAELPDYPTDVWRSGSPGKSIAQDKKGFIPSPNNVAKAFATHGYWRKIGHDKFKDELAWSDWRGAEQWRAWSDNDFTEAQCQLERDGFAPPAREVVKNAIRAQASTHLFDSAQLWLDRLRWDGVPRVETFLSSYMGVDDTPYHRAVGRYLWTAFAGRVMSPGIQADMVVILAGSGGERKTSAIKAMVPDQDFTCRIDMSHTDEANARKMRGRLAVEIAELRGLIGRDSASAKDFISADSDTWTPKYMEFAVKVPRRVVFIGTTDKDDFLADDAGNLRRWLPVRVKPIDTAAIARDRDQLWAEAAERFLLSGVEWEDAQTLAEQERAEFEIKDDWARAVEEWASEKGPSDLLEVGAEGGEETHAEVGFTSGEALVGAVGLPLSAVNRGLEMRMATILKSLGFSRGRGRWGTDRVKLRVWRR